MRMRLPTTLSMSGTSLLSLVFMALFEYIASDRPIFVVTEEDSVTWKIYRSLPQVYLNDLGSERRFCDSLTQKTFSHFGNQSNDQRDLIPQ